MGLFRAACLALGLWLASNAIAQPFPDPPRILLPPAGEGGVFAAVIDAVPDLDGDGRTDLIATGEGVVHLFSSTSGTLLRTIDDPTTQSSSMFGGALAGIADVDEDGFGDVIVGSANEDTTTTTIFTGRVRLFSGATGELLQTFDSETGKFLASFGQAVAPVPDLDDDGKPDVLVGAILDSGDIAKSWGAVYAFSSATGERIFRVSPAEADAVNFEFFGFALDSMDDWDGDGLPEILIGSPNAVSADTQVAGGALYIYSGTGELLMRITSNHEVENGEFGVSVAYLGDGDGDGHPDLAVGAPSEYPDGLSDSAGLVHILHLPAYSANPSVSRETYAPYSPVEWGRFGDFVARLPDINGDGIDDLAITANGPKLFTDKLGGLVHLVSPATGELLQTFDLGLLSGFGTYSPRAKGLPSIDGDALGDLEIGAFGVKTDDGFGQLLVFDTDPLTTPTTPTATPTPEPTPTPTPLPAGTYYYTPPSELNPPYEHSGKLGAAAALVPDVDLDGAPDLLIGEPYGLGPRGENSAGMAHLYSGRNGQKLLTLFPPNAERNGRFGASVSGIADIDGDGAGDLIVGAENETAVSGSFSNGRVYCFSGADGSLKFTLSSQNKTPPYIGLEFFGSSVGAIPDVESDGLPDIVVGAPLELNGTQPPIAETGVVYIFSSADGHQIRRFKPTTGIDDFLNFGEAFAAVPDVNGDGQADLVVGSPGGDPRGLVHLYSGRTGSLLKTIISPYQVSEGLFGSVVADLGDITENGYGDAAVGAPDEGVGAASAKSGAAYLFNLRLTLVGAAPVYTKLTSPNPTANGHFGAAIALIPDIDDDGRDDVAVGAPGEAAAGNPAGSGRIYVFSGQTHALLQTLVSPTPAANGAFGGVLASGPSLGEDARGELLVGVPAELYTPQFGGRVYLFHTSPWPWTPPPPKNNARGFERYR